MPWRDRLRLALARSWKKQSAIAREAGIADATLSRIVNGRMKPSFETVCRVARAADVRVGWLLEEPGFEFTDEEVRAILTAGVVLFDVFSRRSRWHEDERPRWGDAQKETLRS